MNRDHFQGGLRHLRGRGKTAAGAVRGHPRQQVEGAYDQAAGAAQYAYGRARDAVHDLRRDGERLVEEGRTRGRAAAEDLSRRGQEVAGEITERGRALADEATERGRHYRGRAEHHGRALYRRADENRGATLALVAAVAFGLGWLINRSR